MNTFEWCGYNWMPDMKGRKIHPNQPWMWYDYSCILLTQDNYIELFCKKKPQEIKYDGKVYNPSIATGLIRSIEDFGYGIFSTEIMCPKGKNLWPAFWLTGSGNWPPEIDIFEGYSKETEYFKCVLPSWMTTTNMHYNNESMQKTDIKPKNVSWFKQPKNPTEHFIEYKCIWKPDSITFLVNNKIVRKVTGYECKQLTQNIKNPTKGWKMNVVFDSWCENPNICKVDMIQPMIIRNFKYEPL